MRETVTHAYLDLHGSAEVAISPSICCADGRMVVVSEDQLSIFLQRLQADAALHERVKGILVIPGSPASLTPADRFPLAAYAPYSNQAFAWNQNGTGVSMLDIGPVPVFLLEGVMAAQAQQRAEHNAVKVRSPLMQ